MERRGFIGYEEGAAMGPRVGDLAKIISELRPKAGPFEPPTESDLVEMLARAQADEDAWLTDGNGCHCDVPPLVTEVRRLRSYLEYIAEIGDNVVRKRAAEALDGKPGPRGAIESRKVVSEPGAAIYAEELTVREKR